MLFGTMIVCRFAGHQVQFRGVTFIGARRKPRFFQLWQPLG